ncbi:MAG: hypothetical protein HY293_03145 [Planctomycetes bacterium]|nr:hypothetical protein [Planctomycetota bacterium]
MTTKLLFVFIALASAPAIAAAQDLSAPWTPTFAALQQDERGPRGKGGQVTEEWYTPRLRSSLSFFGRASFPGDSDVTIDHLWYSDFFDPGLGLSVEADLLAFINPNWGVGGYLSVGWDHFDGARVDFSNGDFAEPNHMDLTTVLVGGKVMQRVSPFITWEGRMGLGMVHYSSVTWSGMDTGLPFSNEQLFRSINRGAFEVGGRIGFGNRHIEADFGFGVRIMGGAARGRDVTNAIDPDLLTTFMIELGLTLRF